MKHPIAIRWTHWFNFPLFFIMVWSGLGIYWANPVYILPRRWLDAVNLDYNLGPALAWHWATAVVFALNGLVYLCFLFRTGHWRYLRPKSRDFRRALLVAAHDLRLTSKSPPLDVKYNSAQKLAYFMVAIMGIIMVLTGFAIFKPTQLGGLVRIFGGYNSARVIHFYGTLFLIIFFFVHVAQVIRAGWNQFRSMLTGLEVPQDENT